MAVLADAAHEEVDAPGLDDAGFVVGALLRQVLGVAVEDVDVLGLDVDVLEEVVPHERMVAFGMLLGKPHVLVHIERDDIPERHLTGLVAADQLLVGFQRGRTRREAQHERRLGHLLLGLDLPDDVVGGPLGDLLRRIFDD